MATATSCFVAGSALADDPTALLRRAAAAMGADDLRTLRYAGSGAGASFGQAYLPEMHWPKLAYSSYERRIDYASPGLVESVRRARAEPKGGGAVPLTGEAPFGGAVSGEHAWNIAGTAATPRQAARAGRLHDLWTTPHGAIKAAQSNRSSLAWKTEGGRDLAAVRYTVPGITEATAYIGPDYLVERVESRVTDAVLGDIRVVTRYSEYRDFGGIKFPTRIRQVQVGHPVLDLQVKEVQPNAAVGIEVPANVAKATERVTSEQAAPGVWFLAGGSHNSVAIEMRDHVVLVEAPLYDGRTQALFAEVAKIIPGKPVRSVINSHHHFDHSGGLRAAVAAGATLVVDARAKGYFQKAFSNPARITPDALAKSKHKAKLRGVGDRTVIDDGTRRYEIHRIKDSVHNAAFLMVYLPKEKLLIEADAYTPLPPNAKPPATPNANNVNLVDNIARLKLDVERILPLHGRMVPVAELHRTIGR